MQGFSFGLLTITKRRNFMNDSITKTRRLTETAIMIAVATILSYITPYALPMGGSVTLFSQVPIVVIGYRYGAKWGTFTGILFGLLQMLLQGLGNFSYVNGFASYLILILFDYVLAFMALGLGAAFFRKMKYHTIGIVLGAVVASALRFLCHFISGVTIWGEYANGWKNVWAYSFAYNGSYMLVEMTITVFAVIVLSMLLDFTKPNLKKKRYKIGKEIEDDGEFNLEEAIKEKEKDDLENNQFKF